MTIELRSREQAAVDIERDPLPPEILFEEARRRRRRRWSAGATIVAAVAIAGALTFGTGGGGGRGHDRTANGQPSGSGSGATSGHVTGSRLFPDAPSGEGFYTGPGASCPLAPRNRYLPAWSGCVSAMVADVSGTGHPELVMTYSRLSHVSFNSPPRLRKHARRYPAKQAMLRIVSPAGHMTTTPIGYSYVPVKGRAKLEKVAAAALISVAHVSGEPGEQIFLQIGRISSGSTAAVYSLYRGRLLASGVPLGFGGDSGAQAGFQCVAGNPPRLIQHTYALIRGISAIGNTVHIYGWWNVTTTAYVWHGPRLNKFTQHTIKRRLLPSDTVGAGCTKGIG